MGRDVEKTPFLCKRGGVFVVYKKDFMSLKCVQGGNIMELFGSTANTLTLFFGIFTVLIGYWYNKKLERKNRIYSERREAYSRFLRSWYSVIHHDDITEEIDLEYSHAKSIHLCYACNAKCTCRI